MAQQGQITIDASEIWELAEDLGATADVIAAEMYSTMLASLTLIEAKVVSHTPVNTGALRASIGYEIHGRPPDFWGEVATDIVYGLPVELGRKPGKFPPPAPIQLWVRRKLGISDDRQVRVVAFLVARAIARRGTQPGARMFEKGLTDSERQVLKMWDEMGGRIAEKIVGG